MMRFIFWLNRLWHDYRDAVAPRVNRREEWFYEKSGDRL